MFYDIKKSGERIQGLRKAHNMKQTQLAETLNISLDHMKKIEGGQRGCSIDLLISLSSTFDTSLDFLVLGQDPSNVAAQEKLQCLIDELTVLKNML